MTDSIALLQQVYKTADKLALSTALDGKADVKILNFIWFPTEPSKLYFSSVKNTNAAAIYANNPDAALITIPHDGTPANPFVRAHHVTISRSEKTMTELLPRYLELVPGYQNTWDAIGDSLEVYELDLHEVHVDAGLGHEKIDLQF